ncbi:hypothetical protein HO173_006498 [Letharia columbiana]|uniref:Cytochrome P450 n=1 Tax=Letharia columbiana TaxID=112416 RepID=A0A8H6FV69_9LECA|nr:uncharacterized protein HO173_006498 [Letharia columbiana]KAF6235303.1 hypothetical protein HO173_006498 [Letharia columbiana]
MLGSSSVISLDQVGIGAAVVCLLTIAYFAANVLYNLYFHPLRKYPGPKLLAASRIPYLKWMFSGTLVPEHRKLHEQYGPVVRTAPGELSYISVEALKTIYGHRQPGEGFRKNPAFFQPATNGVHSILTSEGDAHSRVRRTLLPAFSDKALSEQQDILQHFTGQLIEKLGDRVKDTGSKPVDLFEWYIWTTFDLIGDLSFGEPFNCLELARFTEWVELVFNAFKTFAFVNISKQLSPLDKIVRLMIPKSMKARQDKVFNLNCDKVDRRIASKSDHPDFLSYIIKSREGVAMPIQELYANSTLIVLAGSESTASGLAGITFQLLKHPEALKKAVDEIRGAFTSEQDIEPDRVKRLPYLAAIVSEGLRMYPPFPEGLPRLTPRQGAMICGQWVPGGTYVQVSTHAAHRSTANFKDPDVFIPERWLGDKEFATDNKEASQPFSLGPRSCIGRNLAYLEMRLILARMLWSFDMHLSADCQDWDEQDSWIQWDKKPLLVRLRPVGKPE